MRKILFAVSAVLMVVFVAGCTEEELAMLTDAQAALETVNEYKHDLNALKAQVDKLNQDVAALQEIVSHSQKGGR